MDFELTDNIPPTTPEYNCRAVFRRSMPSAKQTTRGVETGSREVPRRPHPGRKSEPSESGDSRTRPPRCSGAPCRDHHPGHIHGPRHLRTLRCGDSRGAAAFASKTLADPGAVGRSFGTRDLTHPAFNVGRSALRLFGKNANAVSTETLREFPKIGRNDVRHCEVHILSCRSRRRAWKKGALPVTLFAED